MERGIAAAEEKPEGFVEPGIHLLKGLPHSSARFHVDAANGVLKGLHRPGEIVHLSCSELPGVLCCFKVRERRMVDGTQSCDFVHEARDFISDGRHLHAALDRDEPKLFGFNAEFIEARGKLTDERRLLLSRSAQKPRFFSERQNLSIESLHKPKILLRTALRFLKPPLSVARSPLKFSALFEKFRSAFFKNILIVLGKAFLRLFEASLLPLDVALNFRSAALSRPEGLLRLADFELLHGGAMDVFRFRAPDFNQPVLRAPVPGRGFTCRPLGVVKLLRGFLGELERRFRARRNLLKLSFEFLAGALEIRFTPLSGFELCAGIALFERELREAPLGFSFLYLERLGFAAGASFVSGSLLTFVVGLSHLKLEIIDPSFQFPDLATARQEREPRILRCPEGHCGVRNNVAQRGHEKMPRRNLLALAKRSSQIGRKRSARTPGVDRGTRRRVRGFDFRPEKFYGLSSQLPAAGLLCTARCCRGGKGKARRGTPASEVGGRP